MTVVHLISVIGVRLRAEVLVDDHGCDFDQRNHTLQHIRVIDTVLQVCMQSRFCAHIFAVIDSNVRRDPGRLSPGITANPETVALDAVPVGICNKVWVARVKKLSVKDWELILGILVETARHVLKRCLGGGCAVREHHSFRLLEVNGEVVLDVECGIVCTVRAKLDSRDHVLG